MLRKALLSAAVALVCVAPLQADLKYTVRMELKKSATPVKADPMMATIGGLVTQMMVPGGSVESTFTIGDRGIRVEWNKAMPGMPAGSVMLQRPDGTAVVINPAAKTYFKLSLDQLAQLQSGIKVTVTKTAQTAVVAGKKTDKYTFTITMPLPGLAPGQAPAGMPTEIALEGDAFIAPEYKTYTAKTTKMAGLGGFGLERLDVEGLSMKQVLRSAIFSGDDLESTVTTVAEVTVPASQFEVPAGFKEVPPPGIGGLGGARE